MNEAVIALCKCKKSKKLYGVRFERTGANDWQYTWAFPIKEATAQREGYGGTTITGNIEPAPGYPGCPYCGSKYFVVCQCGKLNCNISTSNLFTCEWCGLTGALTAGIGGGIKTGKDR
ncbi:hypothetical protein FACS1894167_13620 [Synergistales bacterium]|nr:hypothetical protein FACS1894167_13620 [Synergistales bacterium]